MKDLNVPINPYGDEVEAVLISEEELHAHVAKMVHRVNEGHEDVDSDLILVAVFKGTVFSLADFARQLSIPSQVELMAASSYGNFISLPDVMRILKGLDRDIEGRDIVIIEDTIDSGLTLSWLMKSLYDRNPHSPEVVTLLRRPGAMCTDLDVADVGFDTPNEFVIGYGLDHAERYRGLPHVSTLHPRVYQDQVRLRRLLHSADALRRALRTYSPTTLAGFQL